MQIHGLQKVTLIDYPELMAATVFTAGCNFRCPFCHNASLVTHINKENQIPVAKVIDYLKKRKNVLQGVCISGGEPLLQLGLEDFIKEVKELGYLVKLDTNGSNLEKLKTLVEQSLVDYVAMDIKNAPEKYAMTSGFESITSNQQENIDIIGSAGEVLLNEKLLSQVMAVVDYLKTDAVPYEFRTTLVREFHKREDIENIGKWLIGAEKYYLQKFNDSGDLIGDKLRSYSDEIMRQALEIVKEYVPNAKIRDLS